VFPAAEADGEQAQLAGRLQGLYKGSFASAVFRLPWLDHEFWAKRD
jgi:hypothetical protein